jgi:hypothetical protein
VAPCHKADVTVIHTLIERENRPQNSESRIGLFSINKSKPETLGVTAETNRERIIWTDLHGTWHHNATSNKKNPFEQA